jgi:2,3-bisphosphoglycerate-independent phosphoglycerate mutase
VTDFPAAIRASYDAGDDRRVPPAHAPPPRRRQPAGTIETGDVVICFNFRTDRLRELTTVLTSKICPNMDMHTIPCTT